MQGSSHAAPQVNCPVSGCALFLAHRSLRLISRFDTEADVQMCVLVEPTFGFRSLCADRSAAVSLLYVRISLLSGGELRIERATSNGF